MGKASGMIAIPAKLCSGFILIPERLFTSRWNIPFTSPEYPPETLKTSTAILTVGSAV